MVRLCFVPKKDENLETFGYAMYMLQVFLIRLVLQINDVLVVLSVCAVLPGLEALLLHMAMVSMCLGRVSV